MTKKLLFLTLCLILSVSKLNAQVTYSEDFETATVGATSFGNNGQTFNISSQSGGPFFINSAGSNSAQNYGWNGTSADYKYIDNDSASLYNSIQLTISSSSATPFRLNSMWLFLDGGSLTIVGKRSGNVQYTATSSSGFNNYYNVNNGFTLIDLSNFGGQNNTNKVIDQIVISVSIPPGSGYLMIDAFRWTTVPSLTATPSQTNVSCNGGSNGSATVSTTGGVPGYTYSWSPSGGTGATASGLAAGTYTCTITDAAGSSINNSFTIAEPSAISTTSGSQTNVSCFGAANGAARVSVSGGVPGYYYNWTPGNPTGDGTNSVSGLTAGTWTCTVTDNNNCSATRTFTITQPSALVASVGSQTNVSCNGGSNGSATVSATGGVPGYTYSWSPSGGNTATATGLAAGTYTCTVTDANNCSTTQSFTITQPSALAASVGTLINVSCNGGSNGTATVSVTGGTGTYTYSWSPSGGTATTATGLSEGTYTCTVTDANSCTTTRNFTITATYPTPVIAPSATTSINYCQGATATALSATAITGHALQWYTVSTGGSASTTAITPNTSTVANTVYYVSQKNNIFGCEGPRTAITVNVNALPTISGVQTVNVGATTTFTATNSSFTSSALNFDGSDDYATAPAGVYFDDNSYTIEGWVNVKSHANYQRLIDFGNGPGNNNVVFMLSEATNGKPGFVNFNSSGQQDFIISNSALPLNQWVHVAAVRNGSFAAIYINGVLTASSNSWSTNTENATRTSCLIGKDNWNVQTLDGKIGELRIWSSARTLSQIQANMNTPVSPQTDLRLLYNFDQGVANKINTGVTTVTDQSGANYINSAPANGTLNNFALTGSSSNWTYGRNAAQNVGWSSSNTNVATVDANGIITGVAAGSTTITYTNALGCSTTATVTVKDCATPFGNALSFGTGTSAFNADYVQVDSRIFPNTTVANFTIETWYKPVAADMATGTVWNCLLGYAGSNPSIYTFDGGKIHCKWNENGGDTGFTTTSKVVTQDVWNHIALVKNGTTVKLFVNGIEVYSGACGATVNLNSNVYWIGKNDNQINGTLDEVRFWSTARTQAEIQAAMNVELVGNEAGLLTYFDFNQGTGGGSNTGITTVINKANNALNGTLNSFTRTGTSSNFVGSTIANLDISGAATICANSSSQYTHPIAGGTWSISTSGANATVNTSGLVTSAANENITLSYAYTINGCSLTATKAIAIDTPAAPVASSPINYCQGATATALTATALNGNTLQWYTVATNGTASTTAITPNTTTVANTVYYVSQKNNVTGCEGPRTAITVNIISLPIAAASSTSFCAGTPITLTLTGYNGNIQWQSSPDNATWTNLNSATSDTYSITNLTATTYFRSTVSGGTCSTASNVSTISLARAAGDFGSALNFDGANDVVTVPNNTTLNISGTISVEAWIKPSSGGSIIQNVISKSTNASIGSNTGYIFPRTDDNWVNFSGYLHIGGIWKSVSYPYPTDGLFHHLGMTYDGSNIKLYLDGNLVKTQAQTGTITTNTNSLH